MRNNNIKGLGEIVIRVSDMKKMCDFFQTILGLDILAKKEGYTFFKIAEGVKGHHQILALFDKTIPNAFGDDLSNVNISQSSLHHFAFEIDKVDYDSILKDLKAKEIQTKTQIFEWVKWRSIFVQDPESNVIEFVCYDDSI